MLLSSVSLSPPSDLLPGFVFIIKLFPSSSGEAFCSMFTDRFMCLKWRQAAFEVRNPLPLCCSVNIVFHVSVALSELYTAGPYLGRVWKVLKLCLQKILKQSIAKYKTYCRVCSLLIISQGLLEGMRCWCYCR